MAFSVAIPNAEARERFSRNFFDEKRFSGAAAKCSMFEVGCLISENGRGKGRKKAADAAMFDFRCFRLRVGYGATCEV